MIAPAQHWRGTLGQCAPMRRPHSGSPGLEDMAAIVVSLFHLKTKTPKSTTSGQYEHADTSNAKQPHISLRCKMAATEPPASPTATPTTCSSCPRIFFHPDYDR